MKKFAFGIVLTLLFAACAGPKQLAYLQDMQDGDTMLSAPVSAYQLQAGDQLTIRVSSFDQSAVAPFNVQNAVQVDVPYIIDEAGRLTFPGLGAMDVAGKTVDELTSMLQTRMAEMAKGAVVRVELVSAFVTVLGEVHTPTRIKYCPPGLTLAEALADAVVRHLGGGKPSALLLHAAADKWTLLAVENGVLSGVVTLAADDTSGAMRNAAS